MGRNTRKPTGRDGSLKAISTYTLHRRIASGYLPAVKIGDKLIRVRVSDLDRLFPAIPTTRREDRYRRW